MTEMNQEAKGATSASWMVTFADLLSLMLTFFVLLFSMSTVKFENWRAVVATMSSEFNQQRPMLDMKPRDTTNQLKPTAGVGLNLNYLQVLLERSIGANASFEGTSIHRENNQVVVSIPASLLFERKATELKTGAVRPLQDLAGALLQIKNKIRIAGHTDSIPISNGKYRSNWELSLARARIVAGILTDSGYRRSMTVLGFADTLPGAVGMTNDNSLAPERVDIVIVNEGSQKGLYDLF